MKNIIAQMRVFASLLYWDWSMLRRLLASRCINTCVWVIVNTVIAGYVLPVLGVTQQFGAFIVAGLCGSMGFFELYGRVIELVRDMTHDKPLLYFATLPISLPLFVMRLIIGNAMSSTMTTLCVFPCGKLVLGSGLDLSGVNWFLLVPFLLLVNILYGAAAVVMGGYIKDLVYVSNVWIRIAYPMWFMGCYQFSFQILNEALPFIAFLNRFNPIVYIFEGVRALIMGQQGFLPIEQCFFVTFVFCIVFIVWSVRLIRRRLDLI